MRRHGWQPPLHPLQIVGMGVYSFIVISFYTFLGLFLGNTTVEITVLTVFSFVALSVIVLFVRCTAIDPTDTTSIKKKRKPNLNYGFLLSQVVVRFFRRMERKILRCFIKRKYMDPWKTNSPVEPLLPFLLALKDDAVSPNLQHDDTTYCSLCNLQVKKHSKHCRTCNRCVEGFDHHCRWLNNCIGKKNYTCFILLMVFVLLMIFIEGGSAVAIFIRCFADKNGIEHELERRLGTKFPRGVLATISVFLILLMAYSSAALGQLFFFHVVLIRKGMKTYDYILAMKEENESNEMQQLEDWEFSSDDSSEFDSPEKSSFISRFICRGQKPSQEVQRLSIRIEKEPDHTILKKKSGFRASIDPWKLITMSREKALMAKERLQKQNESLKPLPLETKCGPMMMKPEKNIAYATGSGTTPLVSKSWSQGSPRVFSSPRRRFSGSATMFPSAIVTAQQNYRSSFDLKLTEVSKELENYISKQVVCSVLKKDGDEASPKLALYT